MTKTPPPVPTLSPVATVYKQAQEIVFAKIAQSTDKLGRSLEWKVNAIKEDLAAHKDNTYTREFAKEVVRIAENILSKKI